MRRSRAHIWFVALAVALMVVILILPVFVAGALSFADYKLGSSDFNWVGFKNFRAMFGYSSYKKMFAASLTYVLIVVPVSVALGLGSALMISSLWFGRELYKTGFFLPVMASFLAMAVVVLLPFYLMLSFPFKSPAEIQSISGGFFGAQKMMVDPRCLKEGKPGEDCTMRPIAYNYGAAFREAPLLRYLLNSLIVTVSIFVIQVIVALALTFCPGAARAVTIEVGYYNMDALKKAGITELPKTWNEVCESCDKLRAAGFDNPLLWGWNITGEADDMKALQAEMAEEVSGLLPAK